MKRALDVLLLLALAVYILAGVPGAPFHGDESTQVFMSRDFAYLFLTGEADRVRFADPPVSAQEQELRLLNGVINKYGIGLAWHLAGFTLSDLNEQWDWGADWDYNQTTNHAPSAALLLASRWPSALLLVVGMLAVYGLAELAGGRWAARFAAILYALHPALLLNGRRAMMEGSLIAFTALAALLAVYWLRGRDGRAWLWTVLFGLCAGLALASKHTALLAVIPLGAAALGWALVTERKQEGRALAVRCGQMALAVVVAGGVFYALNPAWWGDPLARLPDVLRLRSDLLAGQTAAFGGYGGPIDALAGFLRQSFAPAPQYFEVAGWDVWLAPQIAAYESSLLAGVTAPWLWAAGTLVLGGAGLWALWRGRGLPAARWMVAVWLVSALLAALLLTPIEWQRYYLPVYPPLMAVMGVGAGWIAGKVKGQPPTAEVPS